MVAPLVYPAQGVRYVEVAGARSLFDVALRELGDATQWNRIAAYNGLWDPMLSGLVTTVTSGPISGSPQPQTVTLGAMVFSYAAGTQIIAPGTQLLVDPGAAVQEYVVAITANQYTGVVQAIFRNSHTVSVTVQAFPIIRLAIPPVDAAAGNGGILGS